MLPMSVALSSSLMLMIGRIAYQREEGDGSAQRGPSVIYDYLVFTCWQVIGRAVQLTDMPSPSRLHAAFTLYPMIAG